MKVVDTNTIGGRIRACRQQLNLTLVKLAESINVSSNYMSAVERGVKTPSDKVLHKIADLAKVSYWWLKTGQEDSPVKEDSSVSTQPLHIAVNFQEPVSSLNNVSANIDVPLFLSLAIQSIPSMTKEKLAVMLDVSPENVEDILFGDSNATSPNWKDYFSILAWQMDLPAACQKVHNLNLFLQNENREKGKKRLLNLACRCAGPEYEYCRFTAIHENGTDIPPDPKILYSEHIVLMKSGAPQTDDPDYGSWQFIFYRFDGIDESLFANIMSSQISYCEKIHCDLTLVFDDETVLDLFVQDYKLRPECNRTLPASSHSRGTLSFLLIDRETGEPRGEVIHPENNG